MQSSSQPLETVARPLARLGAAHGYRFERDTVHLNAMFSILDPAAHQVSWSLQLWASPAPSGEAGPTGQRVAEIPLLPMGEIADELEGIELAAFGFQPTTRGEHTMVLVLAGRDATGVSRIHDVAVYPRREQFLHPRLAGLVGYRIEDNRVLVETGIIENPRDPSNLSGTLALELWALDRPYTGGGFAGTPLAGVAFDPLAGQFEYRNRSFDLPFVAPQSGAGHLVLMLREWTAAGFITRDFVNFPVRFQQTVPPAPAPAATATPPPASAGGRPVRASGAPAMVSINTATRAELGAVRGLPRKVADAIMNARPFARLEELTRIQGMGVRLLAKLRSQLKL